MVVGASIVNFMEITCEEWVPDATGMVASGTEALGKSFLLSMFPVGTISLLCTTLEGVECQHSSGAQHRSAFAPE
jgi:hypothetical protein